MQPIDLLSLDLHADRCEPGSVSGFTPWEIVGGTIHGRAVPK
jgi:hypothetical protein